MFKTMFLNVNEDQMKLSIGYIAILCLYAMLLVGSIYAYFNAEELGIPPVYVIGIFFCAIQVSFRFAAPI